MVIYPYINMDQTLTAKQAEILKLIEATTAATGRPPTYRDIAKQLGGVAIGTVQDHLRALTKKGYLQRDSSVARGLSLVHRSPSRDVPILGQVPAGRPIEAIPDALGSIAVSGMQNKGELFALIVQGDSMINQGIFAGDIVVVRQQHSADHGDVVVAMIDGETTVKTLEKKAGRMRLLPANPRYQPIDIPPGVESVIQGKVVALQRKLG